MLNTVAQRVTPLARRLIAAFWPGPLTLVLKKSVAVPSSVTAGADTVAVRCPSHPAARALLKALGEPIAAPSANRSGRPSPTTAAHARRDLNGRVPLILDGGPCREGLESAIVDARGEFPILLRPGTIASKLIARAAGSPVKAPGRGAPPSPGARHRHYAPKCRMVLVDPAHWRRGKLPAFDSKRDGLLRRSPWPGAAPVFDRRVRGGAKGYARALFSALRDAESAGVRTLYAETIPERGAGRAVMDRLRRAAGKPDSSRQKILKRWGIMAAMSLEDWGWDARWAQAFAPDAARGLLAGRVVNQQRGLLGVATADGERAAKVLGALLRKAGGAADLPAVGDWVAAEPLPGERTLVVRRVLPRRTKLSRRAAGEAEREQVIAANLDAALVMTALNADFNARRLERFLAVVRESGIEPVVVLNKLDLCPDPAPFLDAVTGIAAGADVLTISAKTGQGLEALASRLQPGRTVGCVGASGVGKSTLINRLLGAEVLRTAATRASDERGRHTTTHRELFLLPRGGALLDTPGMREMRFWEAERGLAETFEEIEALAPACRFKDCGHKTEPGCAVKAAVGAGTLPAARLDAWRKLKQEAGQARKIRAEERR